MKGVLLIALQAKAEGRVGLLMPAENGDEAAMVKGWNGLTIDNLREAAGLLEGQVKTAIAQAVRDNLFPAIEPRHWQ